MLKKINKRYIIQVPDNVSIIYYKQKQLLIIIGPLKRSLIKLDVKIMIEKKLNQIKVSSESFSGISNKIKKKIKAIQGITVAKIKQSILEATGKFYRNLTFVGVGYRAFEVNNFNSQLFMLKLGFSHLLYFRVYPNFKINCQKFTKLFISGNFYQETTQLASKIRLCKKPEPYKGKGIRHSEEYIKLKKGKVAWSYKSRICEEFDQPFHLLFRKFGHHSW